MGGRLEINNPSEAMRVSNEIVLAWLNNAVNTDYRMAVYGKDSSLTIEDLTTVDPQTGESRYKVKLVNQSGEMQWPNMLVVDIYGDVRANNLGDTFKTDGVTELDFTSPVWIVEGVEGYESRVGDYLRNQLTGSKTVVAWSWASAGIRFTSEGRVVFVNYTAEIPKETVFDISPSYLGGKDGDVIDPDLARAYLASAMIAYREGYPSRYWFYVIPYYDDPFMPPGYEGMFDGVSLERTNVHITSDLFAVTSVHR